MRTEYDVIVVGAGGSGLAAAVSAAEHGLSVLILEKQAQPGGTTGIAVGSFTGNRTRLQGGAGIEDSAQAHAEDAARFAPADIEARNNPELRGSFLEETAETLAWLEGLGLTFFGPNPEPPNRVPRMHNVVPGAKAYIAVLQARLLRLGGELVCGAPVKGLLRNEAGRVIGVEVGLVGGDRECFARRGVVLAAGDYANAPDLIRRFKGGQYEAVEGINPHACGDGHRLAESVGARLINMDITYGPELRFVAPPGRHFLQLLPTRGWAARLTGWLFPLVPGWVIQAVTRRLLVTWQHPENALFEDGAVLVNEAGRRFVEETRFPDRELALARQPGKRGWILLDRSLIERYSVWPHFISTAPKIAYAYVEDYLRLRPDIAVRGTTLMEVAQKAGLPVSGLEATLRERREAGRTRVEGDWVLLGPVKAWFTTTEGGAAIDQDLQVLDEKGCPIPGLYAVGQNGLGGQILWGHGLHIAWALTSGRRVGRVLAG